MDELQIILKRCLAVCKLKMSDISKKPRARRTVEAKQLYVYCALYRCKRVIRKNKIAQSIGVGPWQVTYYRKKAEFGIRREPWFKDLVRKYDELCVKEKNKPRQAL